MSDSSQLVTAEEAAAFLGVAPQTLAQWRWKKIGPQYLKVGRLVRYRPTDLEAWANSQIQSTEGLE